jgi:hypothetical protein
MQLVSVSIMIVTTQSPPLLVGHVEIGNVSLVEQCFSTAGPRPGTGPWDQLYRAARSSPGIFSFLVGYVKEN